jgi:hypothetical protein
MKLRKYLENPRNIANPQKKNSDTAKNFFCNTTKYVPAHCVFVGLRNVYHGDFCIFLFAPSHLLIHFAFSSFSHTSLLEEPSLPL